MSQILWKNCIDRLSNELTPQQFNTWIRPLKIEQIDNEIKIVAPNKFVLDWVSNRFQAQIRAVCEDVFPKDSIIDFVAADA